MRLPRFGRSGLCHGPDDQRQWRPLPWFGLTCIHETGGNMKTVRIEPIKPHIGSIVHIDVNHLLDDGAIAEIRQALESRGVLIFPQLNLTDAQQLAFTDKLGTRLNYTRHAPGGDKADEKDVYRITLDKEINSNPEYV